MTRPLTHQDIRDFLTSFAAVIELDQLRLGRSAAEKFPTRCLVGALAFFSESK